MKEMRPTIYQQDEHKYYHKHSTILGLTSIIRSASNKIFILLAQQYKTYWHFEYWYNVYRSTDNQSREGYSQGQSMINMNE